MIQKVTGFKITTSELTEDRMAMTTAERTSLDVSRRVVGLTTWDTDEKKWYYMYNNGGTLEWAEVEISGDFAIHGIVLEYDPIQNDPTIVQIGASDEWMITLNKQNLLIDKFERNPVVTLYENEIQVIPGNVEITETEVKIKVNKNSTYKYVLN